MSADDLDPRLRSRIRAELERVEPPSPRWANAPARERALRRRSFARPLLLVAAMVSIGALAGAVVLAGAHLPPMPPGPSPAVSPVASAAYASATPSPSDVAPSPESSTMAPSASPSPSPAGPSASPEPSVPADQPWAVTGASGGWTIASIPSDRFIAGIEDMMGGLVLGTSGGSMGQLPSGFPSAWRMQGSLSDFHLWTLPLASSHLSMLTPNVVATDGTRIVLGGGGGTDLCAHPYGGGIWAWDGRTWKAKPFETIDCERIPTAIVHGPLGFVETTFATGEIYGIWRSDDGLAWTKVAAPEPGFVQLNDVVVIDGRYVVSGRGSDGRGVIWSTEDLRTWKRTALGAADYPSLLATSKLALAVSSNADGTTSTWTSSDGVNWTPSEALPAGSLGSPWPVGDGFVVAGGLSGRATKPAIWVSRDGAHWQMTFLPGDTGVSVQAVGLLGSQLVVVGLIDDPIRPRTEAFIRPWPLPLTILN